MRCSANNWKGCSAPGTAIAAGGTAQPGAYRDALGRRTATVERRREALAVLNEEEAALRARQLQVREQLSGCTVNRATCNAMAEVQRDLAVCRSGPGC